MSTEIRVVVHPQTGTFTPGSFSELLQHAVDYPGLDPRYWHVLTDVHIADDGCEATLTVHSAPHHALSLESSLRPATGTPPARVKAHDRDGNELHTGVHAAPLHDGQHVAIGDTRYIVQDARWPHPHPDTGASAVDWQHVTLIPDPPPAPAPTLAAEQPPT